jgi:hypothetical protein
MPYAPNWKQQEKESKRETDDSLKLSSPDCREDGEALPSQTLQSSLMSRLHYCVDMSFHWALVMKCMSVSGASEHSELY